MRLGALCAAFACFAGLQAIFGRAPRPFLPGIGLIRATTLSPIEWQAHQRRQAGWYRRWLRPLALLWGHRLHLRPARIDPQYLIQAGVDPEQATGLELRVVRLMGALAGATLAGIFALFVSGALMLLPVLAWTGYIAPARYLARRRRNRQAAVHRELPALVSMIRAFTAAGMPLERALHVLSAHSSPQNILRQEVRLALGRYGLGLTIEEALQDVGSRTGVDEIDGIVTAVAQSKRIGSSLEQTLRDQELVIRMNQRNRATAQAAQVSTKLLGVLGGIYLPEFVILIIIPLFWGIMQRAFG
jgi:tight adherence protein C